MLGPRQRLRTLMILVLVSALGLAGYIQLSKINLSQIQDLKTRLFLLGSFLLLVLAKLGLLIGLRAKRYRVTHFDNPKHLPGSSRET